MRKKKYLVTGGLGFIGSHFISSLNSKDHEVVCVDNLSNSKFSVLDRLYSNLDLKIFFYPTDLTDTGALSLIFDDHPDITAIIHFAGLKSINDSIKYPNKYYFNNVLSTINLLRFLKDSSVDFFIFSSSATVYGDSPTQPVNEDFPLTGTNPYAWSKIICEQIIRDTFAAIKNKKAFALRYFNPIGVHPNFFLVEDPNDTPNNLMPHILKSANKESTLKIFGHDFQTKDGTAERDFIHVMDLVSAHRYVIENEILFNNSFNALNVGTGKATSVLDLVKIFEKINNVKVPFEFIDRRPGDAEISFADNKLITNLGWSPEFGIEDMCFHSWQSTIRSKDQ
jgi:UDP-glucose 4-epimerase